MFKFVAIAALCAPLVLMGCGNSQDHVDGVTLKETEALAMKEFVYDPVIQSSSRLIACSATKKVASLGKSTGKLAVMECLFYITEDVEKSASSATSIVVLE